MVSAQSHVESNDLVHQRYRVVRMIGSGGMGAVYEAVDERLGARVALKESFANEPELKQQFEREARLLARLKHAALPRVTDYFIEHNHAFLVMEYIEGVSLAELVTQAAPLPVQQVIAWADQVLDVLTYLHNTDRRIVHRDIKPHNLKVTSSGVISLLDFGLAKVAQPASNETESRSVHGYTRRYSPIEQIEDSGTNERSDIYALGATLYHLLTGVRPEDSARRAREISTIGVDCLQRADWVVPAVGEELARVIQRAMAVRSDQRYQTAEEFREALRRLGRVENTMTDDGDAALPRPVKAIGPRRRFARLTAATAIVVFAVTLAGQLLSKRTQIDPNLQGIVMETASSSGNQLKKTTTPATARIQANASVKTSTVANNRERNSRPQPASKPTPQSISERPAPASTKESQPAARPANARPTAVVAKPKPLATPPRDIDAPTVVRAPDGTAVVKYKDGRIRVLSATDHGGQRQ